MTETLRRTLTTATTTGVNAPKLDLNLIKQRKPSNLANFSNLTLVYLGASDEPKPYYKSKKDPICI